MSKKWIVTSYGHDIGWIDGYTSDYLVYDKTCSLEETNKIKHQKNIGYNIYDILYYIINNYEKLPDICVFLKGNIFNRKPEPHCNLEKFNKLINDDVLTPLESYEHIEQKENVQKLDIDGGYMEINNSWYMNSHPKKYFNTLSQFYNSVFEEPNIDKWVRFAPGCNYIVPKKNIIFYSKDFYKKLITFVDWCEHPAEAHMLERSMYDIFKNKYKELK